MTDEGERVLRSERHTPLLAVVDMALPTRKRKTLTPEQLEERRKKVRECLEERRSIFISYELMDMCIFVCVLIDCAYLGFSVKKID